MFLEASQKKAEPPWWEHGFHLRKRYAGGGVLSSRRGFSKSDLLGRESCLNPVQGSLVLGGGGARGRAHLWEGLDFEVLALAITDWPPSPRWLPR